MDVFVSEPMLAVWSALGTLLGALLLAVVLLWASRQVTEQARALWGALRGHVPDVITALDEPTDPLIAGLARLSRVPPTVWAAFLPAFLEALAAGLDQAVGEPSSILPAD